MVFLALYAVDLSRPRGPSWLNRADSHGAMMYRGAMIKNNVCVTGV